MLIVNVYVPQATGALAKEIAKRGENEQQSAGEYATTQLINDLDKMIKSNATPGTAIIIAGDLNMWLQNASPRQNKMIGCRRSSVLAIGALSLPRYRPWRFIPINCFIRTRFAKRRHRAVL